MSGNHRRPSLSPSERRRTSKSRSSSRSHRTPPKKKTDDKKLSRPKTSKESPRVAKPITRSKSSTNARAATASRSKNSSSTLKKSTASRKSTSKTTKSSSNLSDAEDKKGTPANDGKRQDLTARGLSVVPAEIFDLVNLRRLVLANNNLAGVPPGIRFLINLEYLDLSRNPLRVKNGLDDYACLPREFSNLRNLQTLILAECTLKHIPVVVWKTASLQTLDLSRNKVGYIVGEIGNLIDLRHLRLSQMDLDTLPPEIGFCELLQTVDLTGNPIDNLPETLVECRQLYEFKLNYQTFHKRLDQYLLELIDDGKIRSEHLPQVIFEFEHLLMLDLNHTNINTIPIEHTLKHLCELDLSGNSFVSIPEALCTMDQLKVLDMSYNRLEEIDESIVRIRRLEILVLSYNQLSSLSSIYARLSTLKKLTVSHNRIDTIVPEFSQSPSLTVLDLSYNNLSVLPDHLCGLQQLETLDLRYNRLESLPLVMPRLVHLESMNTFQVNFQRLGLHLVGNPLSNLPNHVWKSTNIATLFDYMENQEKVLSKYLSHLKLILIGPKNVGKTTLMMKLLKNRTLISRSRETLDMYVSMLLANQPSTDQHELSVSDMGSSVLTDQWIENRISTCGDPLFSRTSKIKRIFPPALKTYRANEPSTYLINQSTVITKKNLYCTMVDLTSESSFEIAYPLIYDSNALFLIPVNLTVLINAVQAAASLDNLEEPENHLPLLDYDVLLSSEWLHYHILRYIESISDHCEKASIAIIGLMTSSSVDVHEQAQQLLDEIHSKVNMFLTDEDYRRTNIHVYSDCFPQVLHLDDEQTASIVLEQLENLAQQWNVTHAKGKRGNLKQRLGFIKPESIVIDYQTCQERFEHAMQSSLSRSTDDLNDEVGMQDLIDDEINQMTFDDCLDYLKLTGDIVCCGCKPYVTIIIKPYYLFNRILSQTFLRPHLDSWLNYDDNVVFHFSGFYPTQASFDLDRQRLLNRGEFSWNMLNILFYDQHNDSILLCEQYIIEYCRLMERLGLGYVNESNLNYQEFSTVSFVCPWFNHEESVEIDDQNYFFLLERQRAYERVRCDYARRFKQQQLWFALDYGQGHAGYDSSSQTNSSRYSTNQHITLSMADVPPIEAIEVDPTEVFDPADLKSIRITAENTQGFPDGFYQRLLICLHALFDERLDYSNLTLGRSIDKHLIRVERLDEDRAIAVITADCLREEIQQRLTDHLFPLYPAVHLRIET